MADKLHFESKQTDEVEKPSGGTDFFSEIMTALQEALDFAKGHAHPGTVVRKRTISETDAAKTSDKQ